MSARPGARAAARQRGRAPRTPADGWAREDLADAERRGLLRFIEPLSSPQGPVVRMAGETLVNFSSNDYLSLAGDPRLAAAARLSADAYGSGAGASRLIVGDTDEHQALEAAAARFSGTEAARLFNSGYAANVGVLQALLGEGDVVFSDELNHASLIDGCRLSRAKVVVYPHRDAARLDQLLGAHEGRRRLVCTDGVFSMDGDRAPVAELVEVCRAHGAALLVDEAHAVGVLGPRGSGLCDELGLGAEVDVRVGTFGKALGSFGAYAAASAPVCEALLNRARSLVFSTALPPPVCAAAGKGLELCEADGARRERLWRNIRRFAKGLGVEPQSAIFPVMLGTPERALEAARTLRERGLHVKAIRPPTVPEGTSRLRFAVAAGHTSEHIDLALECLDGLGALRGQ